MTFVPADQSHDPTTFRLLEAAVDLADLTEGLDHFDKQPQLSKFLAIYREWLIAERVVTSAPEKLAEQARILLHCMVGAETLHEATQLMVRFTKTLWADTIRAELRDEGDVVALVFHEPVRAGAVGLISATWPLTLMLCEMEFLVRGRLHGVSARVRNAACLPHHVVSLLFPRPILYQACDAALLIPKNQLRRAVVARAADVPEFFGRIIQATLGGQRRRNDLHSIIKGLMRRDKLQIDFASSSLENIATRLGYSSATLRRRLSAEGTSFREIKNSLFDELAKTWLRETDRSIEQISERLDYSDTFTFGRAFQRRNGLSPQNFRRTVQHPIREPFRRHINANLR